jgi:hypothetical protein
MKNSLWFWKGKFFLPVKIVGVGNRIKEKEIRIAIGRYIKDDVPSRCHLQNYRESNPEF